VSVYTIPLYSLNCNLDVTDGPGILSQPMYLCLAAVSVSMTGQPMNRSPGHVRDPFKIGSSQSVTVQQLNNQWIEYSCVSYEISSMLIISLLNSLFLMFSEFTHPLPPGFWWYSLGCSNNPGLYVQIPRIGLKNFQATLRTRCLRSSEPLHRPAQLLITHGLFCHREFFCISDYWTFVIIIVNSVLFSNSFVAGMQL
jgi:hypothetical protein